MVFGSSGVEDSEISLARETNRHAASETGVRG